MRRVLLAMPSQSQPKQAQIINRLQKIGLEVQALPSFAQLIGEEALVDKLTPVAPQNFLGRPARSMELAHSADSYSGRTVLVSGAGGSIGSELCRQVLSCRPTRLVLYELSELALYSVHQELEQLIEGEGTCLMFVSGLRSEYSATLDESGGQLKLVAVDDSDLGELEFLGLTIYSFDNIPAGTYSGLQGPSGEPVETLTVRAIFIVKSSWADASPAAPRRAGPSARIACTHPIPSTVRSASGCRQTSVPRAEPAISA